MVLSSSLITADLSVHPQSIYGDVLESRVRPGYEWLDIGCGRQIVPDWAWSPGQHQRVLRGVRLTGLDTDRAIHEHPDLSVRLIGLADKIPTPENSFDVVTANMVMEHVEHPVGVLREVFRVLRPGGCFIIHTPNRRYYLIAIARLLPQTVKNWFIYKLEHRQEHDVFPTRYRFNTKERIEAIASQVGFRVEQIAIVGPAPTFAQTPLAPLERPILSVLRQPGFAGYRANLIAILRKP